MTSDVFSLRPTAGQLSYRFGGVEPLLRVPDRAIVELATEDCFGGNVRTVTDLPSQVCTFPYLNPVTGPVYVEGAEPGAASMSSVGSAFTEPATAITWWSFPSTPSTGRWGSRRGRTSRSCRSRPRPTAGTWTLPNFALA